MKALAEEKSFTHDSAPPASIAGRLSGLRKAAILLIEVGDAASAAIVRQLPEQDVQKISSEIASLGTVPSDQVERVLEEFRQLKSAGDGCAWGGAEYASKLLHSAFGPDTAEKFLRGATRKDDENASALRRADPRQLAAFIRDEHPQTIALILSNLSPPQAGMLLMSLPPEVRPEVTMRMANLDRISPDVFRRIVAVVSEKLKVLGEVKRSGGARAAAEMLRGIETGVAKEIMAVIEQKDARLVETIQDLMFFFDDILTLGSEGMRALLSKIDRKLLPMALKGTSNQLKEHFMRFMSHGSAEMLRDDMEALGPVRIKDVEGAQQKIIGLIWQLQEEGVISLKESGDQYVV